MAFTEGGRCSLTSVADVGVDPGRAERSEADIGSGPLQPPQGGCGTGRSSPLLKIAGRSQTEVGA